MAGGLVAAIDAVSAAALITAVQAADRDLGAGVFAAFGDLHTAALLFELPRSASSCCSRGASTLDESSPGSESSSVLGVCSRPGQR